MSYEQLPLRGSANAQHEALAGQANLFLFDLKNEATERGFKPSQSWTLELATEDEITGLKRLHYPVISLRLQPTALLHIFQLVKKNLQQPLSSTDMALTADDLLRDEKNHLAAYPTKFSK